MSVAFTTEVVFAHKGISIVAFAREEEKETETEDKKVKEDKFGIFTAAWTASTLAGRHSTSSPSEAAQLCAGHHTRPFTPPDWN